MAEDELDGIYRDRLIGPIEMCYDAARQPAQRCAEMMLQAHRCPSKTARKGYLAAALAFALAEEESHA